MAKSPADRIDSAPAVIRRLRRWIPPTPLPLPRQGPRPAARRASWLPQLRLPGAHEREQPLALDFETDAPRPEFADRLVAGVRRLMVPALIAGVAFYGLVWLVSSLNPVRFKAVFRGYTPATFGVAAFVLMLFLQGLTLLTERRED